MSIFSKRITLKAFTELKLYYKYSIYTFVNNNFDTSQVEKTIAPLQSLSAPGHL